MEVRIDYHNMGKYQDLFQVKPTALYHAHQAIKKRKRVDNILRHASYMFQNE